MEVKSPVAKASSSNHVKTKFFNTIGIQSSPKRQDSSVQYNNQYVKGNRYYRHPRERNIIFLSEELKYDKDEDTSNSEKVKWRFFIRQTSESNVNVSKEKELSHDKKNDDDLQSQNKKKDGGVSFVDTVKVLPIPKRDEYSDRVAKRIWSSAQEIHEMAMRNSVEFAAEGWDWRTVTEDEMMFQCKDSGELIHPVHFESD